MATGNEGHIFAQMKNITDQNWFLKLANVVQAVFAPFLIVDGDGNGTVFELVD